MRQGTARPADLPRLRAHRLAHRVEALEGRLRVSSPVGAATVITAELPVRVVSEGQASKAKTAYVWRLVTISWPSGTQIA